MYATSQIFHLEIKHFCLHWNYTLAIVVVVVGDAGAAIVVHQFISIVLRIFALDLVFIFNPFPANAVFFLCIYILIFVLERKFIQCMEKMHYSSFAGTVGVVLIHKTVTHIHKHTKGRLDHLTFFLLCFPRSFPRTSSLLPSCQCLLSSTYSSRRFVPFNNCFCFSLEFQL